MMKRLFAFLLFAAITHFSFADELLIEPDAGRTPILNVINHAPIQR